jgi:hypothetical protein
MRGISRALLSFSSDRILFRAFFCPHKHLYTEYHVFCGIHSNVKRIVSSRYEMVGLCGAQRGIRSGTCSCQNLRMIGILIV